MKRFLSTIIALTIALALAITALAVKSNYTDMTGDEWYAEAVEALREKNLMNGVGDGRFGATEVFSRAQLATVLYRMAGSPEVHGEDGFADTRPGQWYSDGVLWAAQNQIVNGYNNGLFGTDDPTTQEQVAVMLWRSAGAYVLGAEYFDKGGVENIASDWAVDGVRWARVDGLLTDATPFAPTEPANRAQVADMVYRYLGLLERFSQTDAVSGATAQGENPAEPGEIRAASDRKILVAYFSATGHTRAVAEYAAKALDADLYEIVPETAYTSADLDYGDSSSRTTREQNDDGARPPLAGPLPDLSGYDAVLLGYPIWWGQAPKVLYTFVESYDWTGKTVATFCTSASSPAGTSGTHLAQSMSGVELVDSHRFAIDASEATVAEWARGLSLKRTTK